MSRIVRALIRPELLIWARDSAGYSVADVARKARVSPERLDAWERGEQQPTVNQLRKLANIYKRPLAVFYLSEPPKTFDALRDFRRLHGRPPTSMSPELRLEIRKAWQRRDLAIELFEQLDEEPPLFQSDITHFSSPEEVATRIREMLGITYEHQITWRPSHDALRQWRLAFESLGVLVFQATGVGVSEMRGFAISELPLPTVVVNIQDAPVARIFSMLHELTHVLLNEGSLCDFRDSPSRADEERRIEQFCNYVAGAALVPAEYLLLEPDVRSVSQPSDWADEKIRSLARKYGTSREVILRRLLILGLTTEEFYREKRREYLEQAEEYKKRKKEEGGFAPPPVVALASSGSLFTRLVLDNYYRETLTAGDVSDYLGVRLKHLPSIELSLVRQIT